MFLLNDSEFETLADAAQEAECLHAETGRPHDVRASQDCPHGLFLKGEVVYSSQGAPVQ